jgi:phosphatidylserine/phosphatidylglycerophosphate/cardiolipin synthase-like enzyme
MRTSVSDNGFTLRGFAGTTGVLLAFDVSEALREGLLGFAVQRRASGRKWQWLTGKLGWAGEPVSERTYFPSNERPLQKFRWSDYRVEPGRSYAYRVHPVHGTPDALRVGDPLSVTMRAGTLRRRKHSVLFNRAAAASQAFSLKFPDVERRMDEARAAGAELDLPPDVRAWLSRGVLDQLVGMIDRATGPRSGLDIAIYEYEHPEIVAAVDRAAARGVDVRVVYHARSGDPQTAENEEHLAALRERGRAVPRVTSKIMHDKFIVLSRVTKAGRQPRAVLCGSTNFTENGVYRQANVVHVVEDEAVARRYAELFDVLFSGAGVKDTKAWVDEHNPVDFAAPLSVGFSPRSRPDDLDALAARIRAARRDVLFCTAFDLEQRVLDALLGEPGDDVIRLGVQNKRSEITGYHRDRGAQFAATALLNQGLEGFLKESLARQRGSILIHTKLVVVDFTTDAPFVISGSHNLSKSASGGNDENYLAISGDTGVADDYGVELMRVYDHYRFRWNMKQPRHQVPALTPGDEWTRRYFKRGTLPFRDRRYFAGTAG